MSIELTPKQKNVLDHQEGSPQRVVDPRTRAAYVLVPENEYDAMRVLEEERREEALHAVALRNAAHRLR